MKIYKATIEITEGEFNDCRMCRHFETGSTNFGRTTKVICRLTGSGDFACDNIGEQNNAIENMKRICPFVP